MAKKHSLLKTIGGISIAGVATYASYKILSESIFNYVFKKHEIQDDIDEKYYNWFDASKKSQINVKSYDGLMLNGFLIENHKTNNYVVLVHGIWSNKNFMLPYAYEIDRLGYNILLIDQRASGESEGEYYTYGLKESFDLVNWSNYLVQYNPKINICLFGVSMGAASCMMATQNSLPSNVKCVIEDCGYSSLEDELSSYLKNKYNVSNPGIVLKLFEVIMFEKFGFKFKDISAKRCLNTNVLPILFIHGKKDKLVPFEMVKELYNANVGDKKIFMVDEADHSQCFYDKEYFSVIKKFLKNYL